MQLRSEETLSKIEGKWLVAGYCHSSLFEAFPKPSEQTEHIRNYGVCQNMCPSVFVCVHMFFLQGFFFVDVP